jgi:hypothetical protein
MASSYTHSESFAKLKNIKEDVDENLTTAQWLQTLDHFLESAIDPIATSSPAFLDNFFAKVLAWQSHKPSIKFSRNDKGKMPVFVFNSITTSGRLKRENQKLVLLNRGLLFGLLSIFLKTVNTYKRLHCCDVRMSREKRLSLISRYERVHGPHLYSVISQTEYYSTKAHWFKELIMQKYTRLALVNAKNTYKAVGYEVGLDDIVQTYLIYLSRAIDRCDSRQGVLTSFIQTWFYSARAEVQKGNTEHNHVSYDEMLEIGAQMATTLVDTSFEAVQHLSYTAKQVDPEGVLRFQLGIPEFFTKQDLLKLKLFATHR